MPFFTKKKKEANGQVIKFSIGLFFLLAFTPALYAATYYVSATNGQDTNNGLSEVTAWKTIAKVNASRFVPGDQILFNKGGTWREQLTVPSSGSSGKPITFGAYGNGAMPIITGANLISGSWDNSNGVWQIALTTKPNLLVYNGNTMGTYSSWPLTIDKSWNWTTNVLSVNSTSSPGTRFSTVEAGARNYAISTNGQSYLTFNGISAQKGNSVQSGFFAGGGFAINGASSNVTFQNGELAYSAGAGAVVNKATGGDLRFLNNSVHDNCQGIETMQYAGASLGHEILIQGNNIYNNNYQTPNIPLGAGIIQYGNYAIIEKNILTNNGNANIDYIGIHLFNYASNQDYGNNNIIRYNTISGTIGGGGADGSGIETDNWTSNNLIAYNVIHDSQGSCIEIYASSSTTVENNTCYNNGKVQGANRFPAEISLIDDANVGTNTNLVVKNNIAYATQSWMVPIWVGGNVYNKSGLSITNNLWYGSGQLNWYQWSRWIRSPSYGSNLAIFNGLTGVSANLNANPLFVSPSTGNFHLLSNSPAINAGTNVGLTSDYEGNPVPFGPAPDIGAYEYQSEFLQPPKGLRKVP